MSGVYVHTKSLKTIDASLKKKNHTLILTNNITVDLLVLGSDALKYLLVKRPCAKLLLTPSTNNIFVIVYYKLTYKKKSYYVGNCCEKKIIKTPIYLFVP